MGISPYFRLEDLSHAKSPYDKAAVSIQEAMMKAGYNPKDYWAFIELHPLPDCISLILWDQKFFSLPESDQQKRSYHPLKIIINLETLTVLCFKKD